MEKCPLCNQPVHEMLDLSPVDTPIAERRIDVTLQDRGKKYTIPFTPAERMVFYKLYYSQPVLVTKDQLAEFIYSGTPHDHRPYSETMTVFISKVKRKLEEQTRLSIIAEPQGYRLGRS